MFPKSYILFITGCFFAMQIFAQEMTFQNTSVRFEERNLSGPRMGVTLIPGNGTLVNDLDSLGIGRTISQFGWHFEWQIIPEGGGPQFVVELIPMVGAVEYGKLIPSATLAMGVRLPNGVEFGLGPNLVLGGEDYVYSSLVMAVGKSFNYSGVSIPLNLAYATNPDGNRISVIFGYAIDR